MKWILIAWFHYVYGFTDATDFTSFDSQAACLKSGADALGKSVGGGDWSRSEYAYVCSPGGLK